MFKVWFTNSDEQKRDETNMKCKCPPNVESFCDLCSYCANKTINEGVKKWEKEMKERRRKQI